MSRTLLLGTVLTGGVILVLVFGLNRPRPVYALSVSEFVARPLRDTEVRVAGMLVKGSLCKVTKPCEYRFRMSDTFSPTAGDSNLHAARRELSVRYAQCIAPDLFGDIPGYDVPVTVEGELCDSCLRFEASQLMVRNFSKYETGPKMLEVPTCVH